MTNPRIQQLHQSGAGVGQAAIWDGTTWVPGAAAFGMDVLEAFDARWGATLGYDVEFSDPYSTTLPTDWSWVNPGASAYQEAGGAGAIYASPSGGSTTTTETHRMIVRAAPSESTWNAFLRVRGLNAFQGDHVRVALVLRDSGSGKYVAFGRSITGAADLLTISYSEWSATNTLSSESPTGDTVDIPSHFRISKVSSTAYDLWVASGELLSMTYLGTVDPTGLVASFDQIGILVGTPDSGDGASAIVDSFRVRT